jgi:multisubunit Na+/H+ antiporter MnhG subunit
MAYYRMHTASVASSISMSLPNPIITMIPKSSAAALFSKVKKFSEVVLTGPVVFHALAKPFPKPIP